MEHPAELTPELQEELDRMLRDLPVPKVLEIIEDCREEMLRQALRCKNAGDQPGLTHCVTKDNELRAMQWALEAGYPEKGKEDGEQRSSYS